MQKVLLQALTFFMLISPIQINAEDQGFNSNEDHSEEHIQEIQENSNNEESYHENSDAFFALDEASTDAEELIFHCNKEEHFHTEDCFDTYNVLICENQDEDHIHNEDCFKEFSFLICEKQEHIHNENCLDENYQEPEIIEEEPSEFEILLDKAIYNADGYFLSCGKEEHEHSIECFSLVQNLVCDSESSTNEFFTEIFTPHFHTEECYEEYYVATCNKEEHKHEQDCVDFIIEDNDDVAEEEIESVLFENNYELEKLDFSSKRLLIAVKDGFSHIISDETPVISEYNGLFLAQYDDEEATKKDYLYYSDIEGVDFVEPDILISAANDDSFENQNNIEVVEDDSIPEINIEPSDNIEIIENETPFDMLQEAIGESIEIKSQDTHRIIALLDSGASDNSALIGRVSMLNDEGQDDNGHGDLMIESILSINPEAHILSVKVLDEKGNGSISTIIAGIEYAIEQKVDIINLSLSARQTLENSILKEYVKKAVDAGIIVVGSAGNDGNNVKWYVPGSIEEAVIVGLGDSDGNVFPHSNFGDTVDYYINEISTSIAAAKVSGLYSLHGEIPSSLLHGKYIAIAEGEEVEQDLDYNSHDNPPFEFTGYTEQEMLYFESLGMFSADAELEIVYKNTKTEGGEENLTWVANYTTGTDTYYVYDVAVGNDEGTSKDNTAFVKYGGTWHSLNEAKSQGYISSFQLYRATGTNAYNTAITNSTIAGGGSAAVGSGDYWGLRVVVTTVAGKVVQGVRVSGCGEKFMTWAFVQKPNEYTITWKGNGGSNPAKTTVGAGDALGTLPTSTRSGYALDGWYTAASGGTKISSSTKPSGNTTYYAHWTPYKLTIQYHANKGTLTTGTGTTRYRLSSSLVQKSTDSGSTWVNLTATGTIESGNLDLHNVTSSGYDGGVKRTGYHVNSGAELNTKADGSGITVNMSNAATNAASVYRINGNANLTGNKTITLYVNWKPNTYSVKYNANGGSGTMANSSHTYDTAKALTANSFTRTGYTFAGWATSASGAKVYNDKASVKNLTDTNGGTYNLFAVWTRNDYTISYTLNGGTISGSNPTSYNVDTATFTLKNPTKNGYIFDGWTGTGLTGKTKTVQIPKGSTGNRSYTANFSAENYTITYLDKETNQTLTGLSPTSYNVNTATFTLPTPTKAGYEFVGWEGDGITGIQKTVQIPKGSTGNKTFKAVFSRSYNITYNLDGGEVSGNPLTYNDYTDTFTLKNPTKPGYKFIGWTGSNGNVPQETVVVTKGTTGDLQFTANWEIYDYSINYNLNGGEGSNPQHYNINTPTFTLTNPTRSGYDFIGWTGSNGNIPQLEVTIPQGTWGNLTYSANWSGAACPIPEIIAYETIDNNYVFATNLVLDPNVIYDDSVVTEIKIYDKNNNLLTPNVDYDEIYLDRNAPARDRVFTDYAVRRIRYNRFDKSPVYSVIFKTVDALENIDHIEVIYPYVGTYYDKNAIDPESGKLGYRKPVGMILEVTDLEYVRMFNQPRDIEVPAMQIAKSPQYGIMYYNMNNFKYTTSLFLAEDNSAFSPDDIYWSFASLSKWYDGTNYSEQIKPLNDVEQIFISETSNIMTTPSSGSGINNLYPAKDYNVNKPGTLINYTPDGSNTGRDHGLEAIYLIWESNWSSPQGNKGYYLTDISKNSYTYLDRAGSYLYSGANVSLPGVTSSKTFYFAKPVDGADPTIPTMESYLSSGVLEKIGGQYYGYWPSGSKPANMLTYSNPASGGFNNAKLVGTIFVGGVPDHTGEEMYYPAGRYVQTVSDCTDGGGFYMPKSGEYRLNNGYSYTDRVGDSTFINNAITFKLASNDSGEYSFITNSYSNSMWFTLYPMGMTASKPQDPIVDVSAVADPVKQVFNDHQHITNKDQSYLREFSQGDTVKYTVEQRVHSVYSDVINFTYYNGMSLHTIIPSGISVDSIKLIKYDQDDVHGQEISLDNGVLTQNTNDDGSTSIGFEFDSAFLQSEKLYGQRYMLVVEGTVLEGNRTYNFNGKSTVNSIEYPANDAELIIGNRGELTDTLLYIDRSREFVFQASSLVPSDATKLRFSDIINDDLQIVEAALYTFDKDNQLSKVIDAEITGQTVVVNMENGMLEKDKIVSKLRGQIVILQVKAKIKDSVTNDELVEKYNNPVEIENTAKISYNSQPEVETNPAKVRTRIVELTKIWNDNNSQFRPDTISIVVANKETGEVLQTSVDKNWVKLEDNTWKYSFTVPDEDSELVVYETDLTTGNIAYYKTDALITSPKDVEENQATITNELQSIIIRKHDQNDNLVPNATLQIYTYGSSIEEDEPFMEFVTNGENEIVINLPAGHYILHELSVDGNYALAENIEFVLSNVIGEPLKLVIDGNEEDVDKIRMEDVTLHTLEITKEVTGNMGNKNKKFSFILHIADFANKTMKDSKGNDIVFDGNGNYIFELSHREKLILVDIPYDTHYSVEESDYASDGYLTEVNEERGRSYESIIKQDETVNFVNDCSAVVPTEIRLWHIPSLSILGILAVFFLLKRRKSSNFID